MQKFVQRCLVRIFRTNAPDPYHWTLNSCLGAFLSVQVHFGTVLLLHETWCKTRQTGVQLMQKFVQRCLVRIFRTNAPDPHHWTLNSCFGVFLSVWVHLELFRYCTKLAAKHAKLVQLMQKFVPRCVVRNFRNKRSRSTPLESKVMFWCVSVSYTHLTLPTTSRV